jgi:hypothetical protein
MLKLSFALLALFALSSCGPKAGTDSQNSGQNVQTQLAQHTLAELEADLSLARSEETKLASAGMKFKITPIENDLVRCTWELAWPYSEDSERAVSESMRMLSAYQRATENLIRKYKSPFELRSDAGSKKVYQLKEPHLYEGKLDLVAKTLLILETKKTALHLDEQKKEEERKRLEAIREQERPAYEAALQKIAPMTSEMHVLGIDFRVWQWKSQYEIARLTTPGKAQRLSVVLAQYGDALADLVRQFPRKRIDGELHWAEAEIANVNEAIKIVRDASAVDQALVGTSLVTAEEMTAGLIDYDRDWNALVAWGIYDMAFAETKSSIDSAIREKSGRFCKNLTSTRTSVLELVASVQKKADEVVARFSLPLRVKGRSGKIYPLLSSSDFLETIHDGLDYMNHTRLRYYTDIRKTLPEVTAYLESLKKCP